MQLKLLPCFVIWLTTIIEIEGYAAKNPYAFYMFENFPGCEKALRYELELVEKLKKLRETLVEHRQKLVNIASKVHQPKSETNPIDGFLTLHRNYFNAFRAFSKQFRALNESLKLENDTVLAKKDDYEGALKGIVFLHDTYVFSIPKLLEGKIEYFDHNGQRVTLQGKERLTKNDLLEFSKFAQKNKNYAGAITFMAGAHQNQTKKERKKHEKWRKFLAFNNNELFAENKTAIRNDIKTLPYFVNAEMEYAEPQPIWVQNQEFMDMAYTGGTVIKEYFSRKICHEGYVIREAKNIPKTKCLYYHHFNPYLKLGPFSVEVASEKPHRVVYHKLFNENEIQWMLDYSRPRLSSLRRTDEEDPIAKKLTETKNGTRRIVFKTIQTWFRDVEFFDNQTIGVYDELMFNLTKKISLATQLKINRNTSATDYQTTNYGLGGLCETHHDPYGYLEGATLHDNPGIQHLKYSGDMFGTVMGWLSEVGAGGGTAFSYPYDEQLVQPTRGSAAFWYSLDKKGHIMKQSLHGGCPVLKGQKWIMNKWIFYFDQWRKFPCGLDPDERFESPKGYFKNQYSQ